MSLTPGDSPINAYKGPADLRDVHSVRDILLVHIEEQRAHNLLVANRLGLIKPPPGAPLRERIARWLPTLVTQRAALVGLSVALVLSIVGSIATLPLARMFWPLQQVPPHVHETARAEVPR